MDKLNKYQNILKELLMFQSNQVIYNMPKVKSELIISEDKKHYMIIDMGWHKDEFIHDMVFHFELKNEQIWLHINVTDLDIEKELISKGVKATDIFASFLDADEAILSYQEAA